MSIRRYIATTLLLILIFLLGLFSAIFMTGIPASQAVRTAFCSGFEKGVTDAARETGKHLIWSCGH